MVELKFKYVVILLSVLVFSRCNTDNDTTDPVIEYSHGSMVSNDTIYVSIPEMVSLEYAFSDNQELNSSRLFIGKKQESEGYECVEQDMYSYIDIAEFSSSSDSYALDLVLPDSISGTYSLEFDVLDAAGNVSSIDQFLVVSNESLPILDSVIVESIFTSCSVSVPLEQETISLNVQASCSVGLDRLDFMWYQGAVLIQEESIQETGTVELNETYSLTLPIDLDESVLLKIRLVSTSEVSSLSEITINFSE